MLHDDTHHHAHHSSHCGGTGNGKGCSVTLYPGVIQNLVTSSAVMPPSSAFVIGSCNESDDDDESQDAPSVLGNESDVVSITFNSNESEAAERLNSRSDPGKECTKCHLLDKAAEKKASKKKKHSR